MIYVNGKYRGNDEIGTLIHDFSCTNPDGMNQETLAKKVRYYGKQGKPEKGDKNDYKIFGGSV